MQLATDAPIAIHEADAQGLANPNRAMLAMFGADPSPAPAVLLKDGDTITFGKHSVKVIHTPGHTPAEYASTSRVTFSPRYPIVQGVGRTDLPGGSFQGA